MQAMMPMPAGMHALYPGGPEGSAEKQISNASRSRRPNVCPWINRQLISISDGGDCVRLVAFIQDNLPVMNLVNMATALHRLAKLAASRPGMWSNKRQDPTVLALLDKVCTTLQHCQLKGNLPSSQALSNITWSLATLERADIPLLWQVATAASVDVAGFKPFELSMTLWAFAKLVEHDIRARDCAVHLFKVATERIIANVSYLPFRCLVMITWAFAKVGYFDLAMLNRLVTQIAPGIHSATCQELADIAWSLGEARIQHERLLSMIAYRATSCLHEFKRQDLANMLHGFAVLQSEELQVLLSICEKQGIPIDGMHYSPVPAPKSAASPAPKPLNAEEDNPAVDSDGHSETRTTVMLKDIPGDLSRNILVQVMTARGFMGCYDMVYVPIDFKTGLNHGYGFVNLASPSMAYRFFGTFNGFDCWPDNAGRPCTVSWGTVLQGLSSHVAHYRNSPVMHTSVLDDYKPAIFGHDGQRLAFPAPTKKLRAPRIKGDSRPSKTEHEADEVREKQAMEVIFRTEKPHHFLAFDDDDDDKSFAVKNTFVHINDGTDSNDLLDIMRGFKSLPPNAFRRPPQVKVGMHEDDHRYFGSAEEENLVLTPMLPGGLLDNEDLSTMSSESNKRLDLDIGVSLKNTFVHIVDSDEDSIAKRCAKSLPLGRSFRDDAESDEEEEIRRLKRLTTAEQDRAVPKDEPMRILTCT